MDTGRRILARQKKEWIQGRLIKAANAIQMCIRRYLKRQKYYKREEAKQKVIDAEVAMDKAAEEVRAEKGVFKLQLQKWFEDRKQEYDLNRMHESTTKEEKKKIFSYRRRQKDEERKAKEMQKQKLIDKADEEKIEAFIRKWDYIRETRIKERLATCKRVLTLPETPEEKSLQQDLKRRIADHVKVVLKKADKQKIPMEVRNAYTTPCP